MARDIDRWLDRFRTAWTAHDVDAVLALFADDVTYYEAPGQRLDGDALRAEWETIHDQADIDLALDVFARDGDRFTVRWELTYRADGEPRASQGVYLIRLNDDNLCTAFHQYTQAD